MKIIVRTKERWEKVSERSYAKESELQDILADSPDLIPISELGGGRKSIKIAIREAGLPGSGSTDIIGVDENGNITIIETKLAQNAEIKRKVIGQIIEYAAFLWQKSYEEFDEIVYGRTGSHLLDLMENAEKEDEEWSAEDFRDAVETNLKEGIFALFIVVDEINEELRRIVDYLNSKNFVDFEFYALELKYFQEKGLEVVLPQLYGVANRTSGKRIFKLWGEEGFFNDTKGKLVEKNFAVVQKFYSFFKENVDEINWGKGATRASFSAVALKVSSKSLFCLRSTGKLTISIGWIRKGAKDNKLIDQYKENLIKIGFKIPVNESHFKIFIPEWGSKVDEFIAVLKTILKKS